MRADLDHLPAKQQRELERFRTTLKFHLALRGGGWPACMSRLPWVLKTLSHVFEHVLNTRCFGQMRRLSLANMSGSIDRYYQARDVGNQVPKPTVKLHPTFKAIIERRRSSFTSSPRASARSGR